MVESPVLKGTALKNYCYTGLFNGCTSLNKITAYFATKPTTTYTQYWVQGVSPTGTFYGKLASANRVYGTYGIPTGWTYATAS